MVNKQTKATVAIRNGKSVVTTRKDDMRGQRTRLLIQNAFVALAAKRGFNKISVQEIAEQAMINRATFYRYYKDKYYLAEETFKTALHKVDVEIGPRIFHRPSDMERALAEKSAHAAWTGLFEHFASNSRIYEALLGGKGSAWFLDRMRQDLISSFGRIHRTHQSVVPADVARCFFASATIGITYFWLKGGTRYSPSQMAAWFRLMVYRGYIGTIAGLSS